MCGASREGWEAAGVNTEHWAASDQQLLLELSSPQPPECPPCAPLSTEDSLQQQLDQGQQPATGPPPVNCLACGDPILEGQHFHEDVDGNGGRIHATEECEVAFESMEADKCAQCGEPLLPIEGKFSGEVVEVDGEWIH